MTECRDNDAVVSAIGYRNAPSIDRNLARIPKRSGRWNSRAIGREVNWLAVQGTSRPRAFNQAIDERYDCLGSELARVRAYHVPRGIDGNQSGPGRNGVRSPCPELPVVENGMDCVEPYRRIANSPCYPLSVKLPALNADDDQLPGILRFKLPQLRKDMDAVDSPIGPEVQEYDLSAQVGESQRPAAGMHPVEIIGKLGGANSGCRREVSRHRLFPRFFMAR